MVQIVLVKRPPRAVVELVKTKRTVAIRLPGPRGTKGDKGDKGDRGFQGETGPPSIFVGDTPPANPSINTLWLDTS